MIIGSAGTGKTWTVSRLIKSYRLERNFNRVAISAPTHKAVRVLKREALPGVTYGTIHSLLKLTEKVDHKTGKISFTPDKSSHTEPPIENIAVLILDEVSMLHDDLFALLLPYVRDKGLKLIFCGDKVQIPPVGLVDSIPLMRHTEYNILRSELTEVRRQSAGNPVLDLATAIRDNYKTGSFDVFQQMLPTGAGIHVVLSDDEEDEILEKYFNCPEFVEDPDYMKVIAWRNATVDNFNVRIRAKIYKHIENLPGLVVGEKLVMDKPLMSKTHLILSTNEEIEIVELNTGFSTSKIFDALGSTEEQSFKVYKAKVRWYDGIVEKYAVIDIIHDSSFADYTATLNKLHGIVMNSPFENRSALWRKYYAMQGAFAQVRYNYALTAHKSQGSSYQNALVLKWDIDLNGKYEAMAHEKAKRIEERNRIFYVAITRPRHTLFVR